MRNKNNRVICQYLNEISSSLACPKQTKKFFLRELESMITNSISEEDNLTLSILYQQFGTPDEFACGLIDREDYAVLFRKAKKKAIIWRWIGISFAVLSFVAVVLIVYLLKKLNVTVNVTNPHTY